MESSTPSSIPRSRQAVFALILFAFLVTLAELLGVGFLALRMGVWPSRAELAARRSEARTVDPMFLADESAGAPGDVSPEKQAELWEQGVIVLPVLHPYVGFVAEASSVLDEQEDLRVAELGFPRLGPDLFTAPDETIRIGIFGGSFAAQLGVNGSYLEEQLRGAERTLGRPVRVFSFAMGGYKQPQQQMALAYLLSLGVRLDVVLNVDGFNEIALPTSHSQHGYSPIYPRGWPLFVEELDPQKRRIVGAITYLRDVRAEWASSFDAGWKRWSFVAQALWWVRDMSLSRELSRRTGELESLPAVEQTAWGRGPVAMFDERAAVLGRELVKIWRRGSIQMDALCRAYDIEYHHFLQPNQYDRGSKLMGPEERRVAFRKDHPYRRPVQVGYPRLREAGKRLAGEGVRFHDLSMIFQHRRKPTYRDDCCHVTRAGVRLVLDEVARVLAEAD